MNGQANLEKELFAEALDLAGEERDTFLIASCQGQPELLQRVRRLLEVQGEAKMVLPDQSIPWTEEILKEQPGTVIGRYKLLEQIGEGGFGVVYLADQEDPVRRKVALKVIKAGMVTQQMIARFEAERQALALMDHPNIAKVLDGGVIDDLGATASSWLVAQGDAVKMPALPAGSALDTEGPALNSQAPIGRPYFVMELVRGSPITKFCEVNRLTVKERLELFITVCQAIQHAHQKGIIHRDVKPSNVLVTRNEGVPHAMVIDFGVATATNRRLTENPLHSNYAQMIGTPAYMSPEQAEVSRQDADTRTDVYGLGILLYELLTATTPFPVARLKEVDYAEIQRIIIEEEPLRPSMVLSRHNGRARAVAAHRKCEPAALQKQIKGDLDWIVLKAIEKDRNRRYATPLELVADLQRHMANEPVLAAAPSILYKAKKFTQRNCVAVGVAFVILLGTVFSTWQAVRATRSQSSAEQQAATAEAALRFIQEDLFRQARFQPDVKLGDVIQAAVMQMGDRYQDQPLVEAAVQLIVGRVYRVLRNPGQAEEHLSRSVSLYDQTLGPEHDKTLEAKLDLAWVLSNASKYQEAEALGQEVLRIRTARLGSDHEETLKALICLGTLYDWTARHEKAEQLLQRALDSARRAQLPNYELVHDALQGLAWVSTSRGDRDKTIELRQEVFKIAREHFGPDDPQTLHDACFHVQHLALYLKRFEESARLAVDTYERSLRVLGEGHKTTLWIRAEMADLDDQRGFQTMEERRHILEGTTRALGPENWDTIFMQRRLGSALIKQGNLEEALAVLAKARECNYRLEGTTTFLSRQISGELGRVYLLQRRFAEAEDVYRSLLDHGLGVLESDAPWIMNQSRILFDLLARQGKWAQAIEVIATLPVLDHSALGTGLLAAWLADDQQRLKEIGSQALHRLLGNENASEAFDLARGLLLALRRIPDVDPALVIRAGQRAANLQSDPLRRLLLSALVAWRNNDWIASQELSASLAAETDGTRASLGGFILAMTAFQRGDSQQAGQWLATARERLEPVMRSGDLGLQWPRVAGSLIASQAAAISILGQESSPLVDADDLARAQAAWQPVHDLLVRADWIARRGDWEGALDEYRKALDQRQFSWDAAVIQDGGLKRQLAVLLVLTGHINEYAKFCRERIPSGRELYLLPDSPRGDFALEALSHARAMLEGIPNEPQTLEARHRSELTLGLAHYRQGNCTEALALFEKARGAFNLNCSGTASAFGSMAARRSGLIERSVALFQEADRAFQALLRRNTEDLGPQWIETAIFDLALREARHQLGVTAKSQTP